MARFSTLTLCYFGREKGEGTARNSATCVQDGTKGHGFRRLRYASFFTGPCDLARHFWEYRFVAFRKYLERDVCLSREISAGYLIHRVRNPCRPPTLARRSVRTRYPPTPRSCCMKARRSTTCQ
jgi:hypothetical protein